MTTSTNTGLTAQAQLRRVQTTLRAAAVLVGIFFTVALVSVLTQADAADESSGLLGRLAAWSDDEGQEYVVMIAAIYLTWAVFMWIAARDPLHNRAMVEFTIVGNFVHLGAMAIMAIADSSHRAHLLGDVPLGLVLPIVLTVLWLPVRKSSISGG
jgi:hypothetical protein